MDIRPSLALPQAGALRLIFDEGQIRAVDANGRKYRLRAEFGTPNAAADATGTLTGTTMAAEDSVTIDGVEYTLVASDLTGAYSVLVGVSDSATLDNLIAAINGAAGEGITYGTGTVAHPTVNAAAGAGDTMTVTARTPGVAGNSISTVSNLTAGSWGASALTGGLDATEASAGDMMFNNDYLYLAEYDINKTSSVGWRLIAL